MVLEIIIRYIELITSGAEDRWQAGLLADMYFEENGIESITVKYDPEFFNPYIVTLHMLDGTEYMGFSKNSFYGAAQSLFYNDFLEH